MKAFLLSIPDRLRNVDKSVDVSSVLCSKSWEVLNDDGVKQVFIFRKNKELLISTKGDVAMSTWDYLSVNNAILIKTGDKSSMFHPAYINENLLALEKDGCRECLVLIDERDTVHFPTRTLKEVKQYFIALERSAVAQVEAAKKEHTPEYRELRRRWVEAERKKFRHEHKRAIIIVSILCGIVFGGCMICTFLVNSYAVSGAGIITSVLIELILARRFDSLYYPTIDTSEFNPEEELHRLFKEQE